MLRLTAYLLGLLLVATGVMVLYQLRFEAGAMLAELPDSAPLPELRRLHGAGDYAQAEILADAIVRENLPGAPEAAVIRADCREHTGGVLRYSRDAVTGFVTGEPDSAAAAGGAVVADLLLYGDLRDLAVQGVRKISGRETDPVLAAFAGIGLATELIDLVDWAPAVLKALHRAGALTSRFSSLTVATVKRIVSTRRIDPAARRLFGDLRKLVNAGGMTRASLLMRHVDTAGDLSRFARVVADSPEAAVLIVRNGGATSVKALAGSDEAVKLLKQASRKGKAGVGVLKKCRWSVRAGKIIYSGRFGGLLRELAAISPVWRSSLNWSALGMCGVGALLLLPLMWRIPKWWFRRRQKAEAKTPVG